MSKNKLSFKIIEYKPIIPNINDYYYQILNNDTKFRDYIYCSKNNKVTDLTNLTRNLKYNIKLMKKGKILGVGNLIINQDIFSKKVKQKKYNNISLFITENNYKKIYPKVDLVKTNKIQKSITLSIELNIKYNIKEKVSNIKKIKLNRRNFSFQDRANTKNEYSLKTLNNLTTSTTYLNTFNNLNNCCDNDNNNENINSNNAFSFDKYLITTPSYILSPINVSSPLSESNINNKIKKVIKKGIINNISLKNNNNNYIHKNNIKFNLYDLKNKINLNPSRNNNNNYKYLCNKKKLNIIIDQESSSSNNTNTITQSSVIDSILLEKSNDSNISKTNNIDNIYNNDTIGNKDNRNVYKNNDNESLNIYLNELENKNNKIFEQQKKYNKNLFNKEKNYHKLISTLSDYENKINNTKKIINELTEKNDLLKYKEEINVDGNKEIIPIIITVKESKEIESSIINLILKNYIDNNANKNFSENNNEKYDKSLMVKMLKNVIQGNYNVDLYLKDEYKKILKNICDKYNIFGSIIEDAEE